jgi:hypothetical protein
MSLATAIPLAAANPILRPVNDPGPVHTTMALTWSIDNAADSNRF